MPVRYMDLLRDSFEGLLTAVCSMLLRGCWPSLACSCVHDLGCMSKVTCCWTIVAAPYSHSPVSCAPPEEHSTVTVTVVAACCCGTVGVHSSALHSVQRLVCDLCADMYQASALKRARLAAVDPHKGSCWHVTAHGNEQ
jgi:hypothetical protein